MAQLAPTSLSLAELGYIIDFLAVGAAEFAQQSCDEFSTPLTKATRQALAPVIAAQIAAYGDEWSGPRDAPWPIWITSRHRAHT